MKRRRFMQACFKPGLIYLPQEKFLSGQAHAYCFLVVSEVRFLLHSKTPKMERCATLPTHPLIFLPTVRKGFKKPHPTGTRGQSSPTGPVLGQVLKFALDVNLQDCCVRP